MRDRQPPDQTEQVFKKDWEAGHEYDIELLKREVVPFLDRLRAENKLGRVIADIGCGKFGVSSLVKYPETKIVRVDIAASEEEFNNVRQFKLDLRNIVHPTIAEKKQLVKTRKWVNTDNVTEKNKPVVDTAILTAVLNYIPYRVVLPEITKYVKVGGRLLVFNAPDRGAFTHSQVFSPDRATNNMQIVHLLEQDLGMDVETAVFEGMSVEELAKVSRRSDIGPIIEKGYMLLVARKTKEN